MEITVLISSKLFAITISKTASRFIESYINLNDDDVICGKISFDSTSNIQGIQQVTHKGHIRLSEGDIYDYIKSEYESIINRTSLKDVIVLYRNPIKRTITAISQDLSNIFSNSFDSSMYGTSFLKYLSYKFFNLSISQIESVSNIQDKFLGKWENMTESERLPYELYIKEYIEYLHRTSFITPHSLPYLNFVYVLSNEIDSNKLYLLDIDNVDISKYIEKYVPSPPWPSDKKVTTNNSFNKVVISLLTEPYLTKIDRENKSELFFYNLLKSHSRNCQNQNEA